ncbi:MAG: Ig-like domain-containing protein, partial [Paludibacter sp.]
LRDLKWANYSVISPSQEKIITNPMTSLGWYKVGEFDFSGDGNEYVKLHKTSADSTFADCMMFESVKYDGTILHRTVVTTNPYAGGLNTGTYPASLEQKEKSANVMVGFSPLNDKKKQQASQYNGSTLYSSAFYLAGGNDTYFWNPLVVEPGDYDFYYYNYINMVTNPNFYIYSNGGVKSISKSASEFPGGTFTLIGNYTFAGGTSDEYIKFSGVTRASDILLEKKISNSAILRQVVATCYPYFKEYIYPDTKGTSSEHEVSFMVKKGLVSPRSENSFAPNEGMTRAEFIKAIDLMLGLTPNTTLPNFKDVSDNDWFKGYIGVARKNGLLYAIADTGNIYPNYTIRRDEAAQIMLNAMEYSGNYINVKNIFKTKADSILKPFCDAGSIRPQYREAFGRMVEIGVFKTLTGGKLLAVQELKRSDAVVILKEFLESAIGSGPIKAKTDFQLTFNDEFDGPTLDYTKWTCDDYVRFAGISGKWKENCVVEDGVFKGYNYMDNHSVPYSSGNISSKFKQTYGFFEARYKYPEHAFGSHTSFWSASSSAGDNNYNEGTYPNGYGTNNYFMAEPNRTFGFFAADNLSKDFHTNGGYTGVKDIFYTYDGKAYGSYSDVTPYLTTTGATNGVYSALLSTIVTYFDGPLDRDRLDGTYAAFDWVRVYKVITWQPEVEVNNCIPVHNAVNQPINLWPVLKFNKTMDSTTVNTSNIQISEAGGSVVPAYTIEQMTPLRFRIKFAQALEKGKTYNIKVKSTVKDIVGNSMIKDTLLTFSTVSPISLTVNTTVNSPVVVGGIIQLSSNVSGGSGNYTNYSWTGPNGFSSTLPNPVISGAEVANSGYYYLQVSDDLGNTGNATVFLAVDALNSVRSTLFQSTQIFPNPSTGNIWVVDGAFVENPALMVSVADVTGKVVFADSHRPMPGCDRFDLNLSQLDSGLYFLNLKTDKIQRSLKLIIRK